MNILILGGTRFIGKSIALHLTNLGHSVTVLSRRHMYCNSCNTILADKKSLPNIDHIQSNSFDYVFDFICYEASDILPLLSINAGNYIMISSAWVPFLWSGTDPSMSNPSYLKNQALILDRTRIYLEGKHKAEIAFTQLISNGLILRLPVILGLEDHTKRYKYLVEYAISDFKLPLMEDNYFYPQILHVNELNRLFQHLLILLSLNNFSLLEAVPTISSTMPDIIKTFRNRFLPASNSTCNNELTQYIHSSSPLDLNVCPFFHTPFLSPSSLNIFNILNYNPQLFEEHPLI